MQLHTSYYMTAGNTTVKTHFCHVVKSDAHTIYFRKMPSRQRKNKEKQLQRRNWSSRQLISPHIVIYCNPQKNLVSVRRGRGVGTHSSRAAIQLGFFVLQGGKWLSSGQVGERCQPGRSDCRRLDCSHQNLGFDIPEGEQVFQNPPFL